MVELTKKTTKKNVSTQTTTPRVYTKKSTKFSDIISKTKFKNKFLSFIRELDPLDEFYKNQRAVIKQIKEYKKDNTFIHMLELLELYLIKEGL